LDLNAWENHKVGIVEETSFCGRLVQLFSSLKNQTFVSNSYYTWFLHLNL